MTTLYCLSCGDKISARQSKRQRKLCKKCYRSWQTYPTDPHPDEIAERREIERQNHMKERRNEIYDTDD